MRRAACSLGGSLSADGRSGVVNTGCTGAATGSAGGTTGAGRRITGGEHGLGLGFLAADGVGVHMLLLACSSVFPWIHAPAKQR
jgi:hypothetical protein